MATVHNLAECVCSESANLIPNQESSSRIDPSTLYQIESSSKLAKERPWRKDAKYFNKTYISSLALLKMTLHATSGGSIEIMGMMTGKVIDRAIVVMDVYPLPVEGTETRVNAQAEGYEYMVQYLEQSKKAGRNEHIVGWYHSHPGYGCWLSGIDVATQSLNQNFQDPYLAIVVDPLKTKSQGIVEIGAFRTYPDNFLREPKSKKRFGKSNSHKQDRDTSGTKRLPKEKRQDFGAHFEDYYALEVEIFKSKNDSGILDLLTNNSWKSGLILNEQRNEQNAIEIIKQIIDKFKAQDSGKLTFAEVSLLKKYERTFEEDVKEKLLTPNSNVILNTNDDKKKDENGSDMCQDADEDDEMSDESDLEAEQGKMLDVSDVDDAMSMESSSLVARNKRNDSEYEDENLEDDDGQSMSSNANSAMNSLGNNSGSEIDFFRKQRKMQRRKQAGMITNNEQLQQRLALHSQKRSNEQFSAFGEHEMKMAKNNKNLHNIQDSGNKVAATSLEYLLTLRAQQKIFGDR